MTHATDDAGRLEHRLERRLGQAIGDFELIEPGDRILVGVSGGKDSWALLDLLRGLRRRAPVRFDLVPLNVDQGFAGFRADLVEDYLAGEGYAFEMRSARINLTVKEKIQPGETFCSLCARLRRGALYRYADELACNKIALGHHADDFIETLLLNLFFNGQIKAMHPRLRARNGRHTVIRPLVYVWEDEIVEYTRARAFPVVCCACPGCKDPTLQRHRVKRLLRELERTHPGLKRSLLGALSRVDLASLPIPERRAAAARAAASLLPLVDVAALAAQSEFPGAARSGIDQPGTARGGGVWGGAPEGSDGPKAAGRRRRDQMVDGAPAPGWSEPVEGG